MDYKMADMSFLLLCVDWIRNLSDRQHFYVNIHVGDFKFVFDNKDQVKKNRNPSQLKRNYIRRQDLKPSFGEQANETAIDKITEGIDEVQTKEITYDLKVEAGPNIKNHDIVEAIELVMMEPLMKKI